MGSLNLIDSGKWRARLGAAALVVAAAWTATPAWALFDVEGLLGKRWYELSTSPKSTNAATELVVAAHLDPIPLVPVAFGARVAQSTWRAEDYPSLASVSSAQLTTAAVDVTAWLPLVPVATPYVRLSVPVYGAYAVKGKLQGAAASAYEETGSVSGADLGLGLRFSILPLVKILIEVNHGAETYQQESVKVAGASQTTFGSKALASNAVLLGVTVGL